jgi:Bifunctional DNA primase/polymerase, N-terminal
VSFPTDARLAARFYIEQYGMFPVRVPPRTKGPNTPHWEDLRLTHETVDANFSFQARNGERHFFKESNIGILTGYGVLDIDCDCDEVVAMASTFLPPTPFCFGHKSSPASHWFYSVGAEKSERFSDPMLKGKDAVMVEIRGSGRQTIVPPSIHEETGEPIEFSAEVGAPAVVDAADLRARVAALAAAALLARYWPTHGDWSKAEMALAGTLRRGGYESDVIESFINAIYRFVKPVDAADTQAGIRRFVATTCEKLEAGDEVTGLTTLAELVGPKVARTVAKWLGLSEEAKESKQAARLKILFGLIEGFDYFVNDKSEAYVSLQVEDAWQTLQVKSGLFKNYVKLAYHEATNDLLSNETCESVLDIMAGRAVKTKRDVYVRFGWAEDKVYLDLANEKWQVVEIDSEGWRILDKSPIPFRRDKAMKPLPVPVTGGSLADLFTCVNAQSGQDQIGYIAWLLSAFHPTGTLPILSVTGSHGSGKSATIKKLKSLTDDSSVALCSKPRDERDIAIAMKNSAVVAYDNLSGLPEWISDAFCRVCDKAGFRTRLLRTDDEEALFSERRSLIVSGIDNPASRADLADRCISVQLESIEAKETEQDLDARFEDKRAGILGALLTVVSAGLKVLPDTKADATIRMSDFCRWIVACEPALGWEPGTFQKFYKQNRQDLVVDNLTEDSFLKALANACRRKADAAPWVVTSEDLLSVLAPPSVFDPTWPKSGKAIGMRIHRGIPSLSAVGIETKKCKDRTSRWFEFRITGPIEPEQPTPF